MSDYRNQLFCNNQNDYRKVVNIPIELYESIKGEYFIGYADELSFGNYTSAWARLYNPCNSGVNLHVNVWTVTDISTAPFRAQFWFNADPPGIPSESTLVTPSNTAIRPTPIPKVKLQLASNVTGEPTGGVKAFVRRGEPEITLVETENGKLIFPPGGSFLVFLTLAENPNLSASGRVAFGWWEEKITCPCRY
ncbi:hypothetical protein EDD70_1772 [Hydrogenoanaerobacterium saccharovorans]|uniref:Uncharacterized protein n=1 Tax=Hydrogenoanaerobacterium saccharovorans TaxID=474960 RepID=A0A1H7YYL0_9FIRM|nr:DUF6143 family protein [Hydrogenoanaerobacterium saccharovorans]RPF48938.1 hypothetical protein EDD70_1772 [Hydrogenoanaerobacterium saccharovorans]SEM50991.1 hypothetical protein SAMN05216180_0324 [Hydrogenoanaerobacterium saccharovorans]